VAQDVSDVSSSDQVLAAGDGKHFLHPDGRTIWPTSEALRLVDSLAPPTLRPTVSTASPAACARGSLWSRRRRSSNRRFHG